VISLSAWEWAEAPPIGVPLAAIDDAVMGMEKAGVRLDTDFFKAGEISARHDLNTEFQALRHWAADVGWHTPSETGREWTDSIWTSPQKLQVFLHSPIGLGMKPSPFWKKGRVKVERGEIKTDATALEYLAGQYPEHRAGLKRLLAFRKATGALKYLAKLPGFIAADGLVHPVFGPAGDNDERSGTITGRQACKNPEFHQIPRDPAKDRYRIRTGFVVGPDEELVVLDYSALEIVVLAHILIALFGDDQLAQMIMPGQPDIHSMNAVRVYRDTLGYKEFADAEDWVRAHPKDGIKKHPVRVIRDARDLIKAIWYGLQYGKGEYGFGNTLFDANGDPIGEPTAKKMIEGIFAAIPGLKRYQEWVWEYINTHGGICDIGGRWCDLRELLSGDEWAKKKAWRRALNFPMQASGAVIVGTAMVRVSNDPVLRAMGAKLVLSVHDELHLRVPKGRGAEALARAKEIMLDFPLYAALQVSGDWGYNWEDTK
jgi:DNA polymerase I